jgi:hypothetical protein
MLHFKLGLWSAADMFLAILSDNLPQSAEFSTGSKGDERRCCNRDLYACSKDACEPR